MSPFVLLARVAADADGLPRIPWSSASNGASPSIRQSRFYAPGPLPFEAYTAEHFDRLGPDAPWPSDGSTYVVDDLVLDERAVHTGPGTGAVPEVLRPTDGERVVAFAVGRAPGGAGARPATSGPGGYGRPPLVQGNAGMIGRPGGGSGGQGLPDGAAYAAPGWQQSAYRALQRSSWALATALVPVVLAEEEGSETQTEVGLLLRNAVESGVAYGRCRLVRAVGPWGLFDGRPWTDKSWRNESPNEGSIPDEKDVLPHVRYELAFFHEAPEASDVQFLVEHIRSRRATSSLGYGTFPPSMGDGDPR